MDNPKVSIIIPTYKRAEYLSRAIKSCLNQSYENIEVIVVDDNGANTKYRKDTESIMEAFKCQKVIYLKHEQNRNGAAARNTGINRASGEYITFLDDDDEYLPMRIEYLVKKMNSLDNSWGACYTAYKKINRNDRVQIGTESREGNLLVPALMRSLYIGSGSNIFVRRNVVVELNGFDESFTRNQDLEFLVRLLKKYKLAHDCTCSLIVHYEIRDIKHTYDELRVVDQQYIIRFKNEINLLSEEERNLVYTMIKLDDFRNSIVYKKPIQGIKNLIIARVSLKIINKYFIYLFIRALKKESYGFIF